MVNKEGTSDDKRDFTDDISSVKSTTDLWRQYSPMAWSETYSEFVKYTKRMTEIYYEYAGSSQRMTDRYKDLAANAERMTELYRVREVYGRNEQILVKLHLDEPFVKK